ncbi:hypothetical protein ACS5PK_20325 [Roseateles sp. DB2]|uniref:hypothetical protein n=1 Tax=Roseateles sp. DB2 TaxID=3453717 RepID=UPI003EEE54BD
MQRSAIYLLACLTAALAVCLLMPGRGGEFVFDDLSNIVDNTRVHLSVLSPESIWAASFSYQPGHGSRPLAMLSFALDYWRAGGSVAAVFKQTNLIIHGLTVLALVGLVRQLLRIAGWPARQADIVALGLALAWGIHPIQVSAVLYVVQRMQTLSTLFLILALWAYVAARTASTGSRSVPYWRWALFALLGLLGFACKEDVLLLPGFTWILELTLLGFRSGDGSPSRRLWQVYLALVSLGVAVYLLLVVPYYWTAEPYPWRNFSSLERLLTQARVLVMYLGQIALPLPQRLPFYYDDLEPSRGLLDPPGTLASLVVLAALAVWAWRWRTRRPLFSTGILLFLMGHFMTSNVLNLELAFEHRNHFPLIGILLAVADLGYWFVTRFKPSRGVATIVTGAVLVVLALLTFIRASVWGSPLQFALQGAEWAPTSPRAWQLLCKTYFHRSGGETAHPFFSMAIQSCQHAAELPGAIMPLADLITLRTLQGAPTQEDWAGLEKKLRTEALAPEVRDLVWTMIVNINNGVALDARAMVRVIAAFESRLDLKPVELANLANYVLYQSPEPEKAYAYYQKALRRAAPGDPLIEGVLRDLTEHGMKEWADRLRKDRAG